MALIYWFNKFINSLRFNTMSRKSTLFELLEEYNNLFKGHCSIVSKEMEARKAIWLECLCSLAKSANRSYSLLNLNSGQFEANFSAYSNHLLQSAINLSCKDNWKKMIQNYHKNDCYINVETSNLFYNRLMSLPFEHRQEFVLLCLQRLKNKSGKYDIYLLRYNAIVFDAHGIPWLVLVEAELLSEFNPNEFQHIRQFLLINKQSGEVINHFEELNINNLTEQEFNVLKLACKKSNIKEMADKLSVSEYTIKSHRYQVMKKLNAPSLSLACFLARSMRIV
jgi:DNA-binding CsgD family transcriptional regulator